MSIRIADTGELLVLSSPLKEVLQDGILTSQGIRYSGVQSFRLPPSNANLTALDRIISPDATGKRKYLDIKCDIGEYDRIYFLSINSYGISVRIEWSGHPFLLASKTPINTIDLGTFRYDPISIETRQGLLDIPDSSGAGEQYPTVQFGQIFEEISFTRRPHIAWAHHRPHVNPHWLIRKGFQSLGFEITSPIGQAGPATQDIAYLLKESIGTGLEDERYLKISKMESLITNINGTKGVYSTRTQLEALTVIADPGNRLTQRKVFIPHSGEYKIKINGIGGTAPDPFSNTGFVEDNNGFAIEINVIDPTGKWPMAKILAKGQLDDGSTESVGKIYAFDHEETIWLSQGQIVEFTGYAPPGRQGAFHSQAYYAATWDLGEGTVEWPEEPYNPTNPSTYGDGLEIELICEHSWFSFGSQLDWRNILDGSISLMDVLKGVVHLYNLKCEYDHSQRTVYVRPANETEYGDETLPAHYLTTTPVEPPLRKIAKSQVTANSSNRASKAIVGFRSGEEHQYTYEVPGSENNTSPSTYPNPLFSEVQERLFFFVRDEAFWYGTPAKWFALNYTPNPRHYLPAVAGNGSEVIWDVNPYIIRYFGNDRKRFPVGVKDPLSPLGAATGVLAESIGQDRFDNNINEWSVPYAGHVSNLVDDLGTPYDTPPLAYNGEGGTFPTFWEGDFVERYNGSEIMQEYECGRLEARQLSFRKKHLINYEGRPIECKLLAIDNVDGDTARARFVTVDYERGEVQQGIDCSLNVASINIFVEDEEVYALFGFQHQELPVSITYEVSFAQGPFESYTPGQRLGYLGGGLLFQVTVAYENCPTVIVRAEPSAVEQSVPCGDTPLIDYSFNAVANTVSFVNGPDLVDFPFSDVMEINIDAAGFIPYTQGTLINGFTSVTLRRTAQRSSTCPPLVNEVVVGSESPSTPNVSTTCNNKPYMQATVVGNRIAFSVNLDEVDSPHTITIKTKKTGSSVWAEYLSTPVKQAGEVFATIEYSDGCPTSRIHYEYDLSGNLTPLGNTQQ